MPLVLGLHTDPVPDFAVVAGHPVTAALVVEVADTSLRFDTNDKRLLYAGAGIPDYWVVDVNARRLLVYRNPQGGDYTTTLTLDANDAIAPLAVQAAAQVADILG
jgi:Uma2 family endonuclease